MKWYVVLFIILGLINILNYIKAFKTEKHIAIDTNQYRIINKEYYKIQLIMSIASFINIVIWSIVDIWTSNIGLYSLLVLGGYMLIIQVLKTVAIKRNYICDISLE